MSVTFNPGGKPSKPPAPHGQSHKTLTIKVKAHTRKVRVPVDPLSRPAAPGSSYTLRALQQLENAAANEKYGQEQSLLQQRQQQIPGYFNAYRSQIAQAQQAQQQRAAQQVQALTQLAASAGQVGSAATPEAQAAANVRQSNGAGQAQLAQQIGGLQDTFLGNLGLLSNTNQTAEQSAGLKALADLAGQIGGFKQTYGQQALSDEAKARLENAAFGLNQAKAASTISTQQQTAARARGRARRDSQKLKDAEAKDAYQRAHHVGPYKPPSSAKGNRPQYGPGSLTQAQESGVVQQVKGATAAARRLMSQPGAASGEVRALLAAGKVDGHKYDHDIINAAFDLLPTDLGGRGGLSAANIKALRAMGVHVNRYFKPQASKTTGSGSIPSGKI